MNFASFPLSRPIYILPKQCHPSVRLDIYRKRRESRKRCGPYTIHSAPSSSTTAFFYHDSDFAPGLRWDWCDDVAPIKHTGWFCDEYQSETIRGLVFRLPKGRGYLAGWSMGEGMASEVNTSYVYAEARDAGFAADSMAESAAEREREYQEAFQRANEELED